MKLKERRIGMKRSKLVPNSVVVYFATTASDENDIRKNAYSQIYGFSKILSKATSEVVGISLLHFPKVTLQFGKGRSEKHLRHCLRIAETFPDAEIVYTQEIMLKYQQVLQLLISLSRQTERY